MTTLSEDLKDLRGALLEVVAGRASNAQRQTAYQKRRKDRGDHLVPVWMTPETWALWQALHPRHGGTEETVRKALQQLKAEA